MFWLLARESHLSLQLPQPALDSFLSLKGVQAGQLSDQLAGHPPRTTQLGAACHSRQGRRGLPVLPRWDGLFQTMLKEAETTEGHPASA